MQTATTGANEVNKSNPAPKQPNQVIKKRLTKLIVKFSKLNEYYPVVEIMNTLQEQASGTDDYNQMPPEMQRDQAVVCNAIRSLSTQMDGIRKLTLKEKG